MKRNASVNSALEVLEEIRENVKLVVLLLWIQMM
jgi:hypothetical protein